MQCCCISRVFFTLEQRPIGAEFDDYENNSGGEAENIPVVSSIHTTQKSWFSSKFSKQILYSPATAN
jgi:hypothetical protein